MGGWLGGGKSGSKSRAEGHVEKRKYHLASIGKTLKLPPKVKDSGGEGGVCTPRVTEEKMCLSRGWKSFFWRP